MQVASLLSLPATMVNLESALSCNSLRSKIIFKTTGVLLEELRGEGLAALLRYKVVVLDEIHERSVESDLVLTCVKQFICALRRNNARTSAKVIEAMVSWTRKTSHSPIFQKGAELAPPPPLLIIEEKGGVRVQQPSTPTQALLYRTREDFFEPSFVKPTKISDPGRSRMRRKLHVRFRSRAFPAMGL
eukprot:Gb_19796 [translate_table: standard]